MESNGKVHRMGVQSINPREELNSLQQRRRDACRGVEGKGCRGRNIRRRRGVHSEEEG